MRAAWFGSGLAQSWGLRVDSGVDVHVAPARAVRATPVSTVVLRMAVGLVAGAVLMLIFLRLVSFGAVVQRLEHLSVSLALLCGLAFLGAYAVRALRWRMLLKPYVVSIPRAVAIYLVAIFINWLLPLRGGELAKSLLLRHSNGIPVSRSLPTVTMDKAMDLLPAVGLLALLPFVHLRMTRPLWLLLVSALAVLGLGALVLGLAAWRRDRTLTWLTRVLVKILPRSVRRRVEPFVVQFIDTLLALIRQPRLLFIAALYTAVAVGLDALFCWLAFRAVGESVALPVILYGYTLYNLAYLLPTLPGQVGSNELIGLLIFSGVFGVSRSAVGAMFLFSHPWTAILMAGCGVLCLAAMGLTLRATFGLARDPEVVEAHNAT
jgi:uncharacterized protein (TIRG00374 family)